MEKIFLDTNTFIDLVESRDLNLRKVLSSNEIYASVASIGIWTYVYKKNVPNKKLLDLFDTFNFVENTNEIAKKAMLGPTKDYEDNVQLHSSVESLCEIFLTKDKDLLKLGYFGKVAIKDSL